MVYSENFAAGPGARLFYHASLSNDGKQSWVQELIWDQSSNTWSPGQQFKDPVGTSQLAAVLDKDRNELRLFYCTGNCNIAESKLDITDATNNYTKGTLWCTVLLLSL